MPASAIPDGWMGLDIWPDSINTFSEALETTKTVIWNGPMGVFEFDKFAVGTEVKMLGHRIWFHLFFKEVLTESGVATVLCCVVAGFTTGLAPFLRNP